MEIVFVAIPNNPDRQSQVQVDDKRKVYAATLTTTVHKFTVHERINLQWKMNVEYYVQRQLKRDQTVKVTVEGNTFDMPYKNAFAFSKALAATILTKRKDKNTRIDRVNKPY